MSALSPLGPPPGWYTFGTYADPESTVAVVFSTEVDDAGVPLWERPRDVPGDERTGPDWEDVRGFMYDRQNHAISLRDWVDRHEHNDYRILARENPREDLYVSTIWMGTGVTDAIFETGVFRGKPGEGGRMVYAYSAVSEPVALAIQAYVARYVARFATFPDDLPDDLDPEQLT